MNDPLYLDEPSRITLRDTWNALLRNLWLIAILVVAGVGVSLAYTARQPRLYGSEATLQFADAGRQGLLTQMPSLPSLGGGGAGAIETDLTILRSRRIAEDVVDSLDLQVAVVEPDLPRSAVLSRISAPIDAPPGTYVFRRQPDGSYLLQRSGASGPGTRVAPGEPASLGTVQVTLGPEMRDRAPETVRVAVLPFRAAVAQLRGRLEIAQPNVKAQIANIRFVSRDPELAAEVPNAVATSFIRYKSGTSKSESHSTVGFLREQVANYERQLREAEGSLREFRQQGQIVSLEDEASEQVTRLADLQAKRDEIQVERESLRRLLDKADSRAPGTSSSALYRELAAFPVFFANKAVQDILQSLTQLDNQRAELLLRRTSDNPDVQGIEQRIGQLETQLYQTARSYLESLDSQISSLDGRLAQFRSQLELVPGREIEFARLSRQQTLLEDIYTLLHTRLKEAELQEAVQRNDVRLLDPALVPDAPISPRPLYNLALGLLVGLLAGGAVVVLRESLDSRIRTRVQLAAVAPGRPILGAIPRIPALPSGGNGRLPRRWVPVPALASEQSYLVTRTEPNGIASEAFRALRTNILFGSDGGIPQVLAVTSAMPGEGKSTSAANLAVSFARQGMRTLLVDADLRRGTQHSLFGLQQGPGLVEVLRGQIRFGEAVRPVPLGIPGAGLGVLTSGAYPTDPSELLGSSRMEQLLAEIRGQYDLVIFDLPSANIAVDAIVISRMADTTLLVTRYGVTHEESIRQAVEQLEQLRIRVGGVILNDVAPQMAGQYGMYGYMAAPERNGGPGIA